MSRITLNLRTAYNFNTGLFDLIKLPNSVNKETLINLLMFCYGRRHLVEYDIDIVKLMIGEWSAKELDQWQRMEKALGIDYNPIENYDRYEDFDEQGTSDSEDKVVGYNSEDYTNQGKNLNKSTNKHVGHIHGNIGVTTNQQMILSEVELRKNNCLYDIIMDSFAKFFLTGVFF